MSQKVNRIFSDFLRFCVLVYNSVVNPSEATIEVSVIYIENMISVRTKLTILNQRTLTQWKWVIYFQYYLETNTIMPCTL